ncbi:MAG: cysteine--tRNA ligase [Candidatus Aenigmarchaeota archaeon]|nr:cysteine--tRNA ligase [Candidatus Aenigmarchaeota archaeon]MDI6722509.1 cysteine--tRNA ligase [Candidatus Aenigmarchaeota archaeon]
MMLLYNTLTRRFEELKLHGEAKIYFCGPTVYDFAHIGNFRSYLVSDLLVRYLIYKGYTVKLIMNITDVDDKTIKGAVREGVSLHEFTKKYEDYFFEDMDALRIKRASFYPHATEHIDEMITIIKKLIAAGIAYRGEDGSIYYDITKFGDYGRLSHLDLSELKSGSRVKQDSYEKDDVNDFALWKAWDEEDGDVYWDTELGRGRPGWHIECSAMSMKYLGEGFDIHGGGVDLMFPHHENEIAQSEAFTHKKFVNLWLHCEHLLVDGRKMSKSLGNFYTLRDIAEKGYNPLAFRYLCLSTHYRSQINFTFQSLEDAWNTVQTLNNFVFRLRNESDEKENITITDTLEATKKAFEMHMDDDLDVQHALAAVFELIHIVNKEIDEGRAGSLKEVLDFVLEINDIFDILIEADDKLTEEELSLVNEREEARRRKDFRKADEIRDMLKKKGILVEDSPSGPRWKKA